MAAVKATASTKKTAKLAATRRAPIPRRVRPGGGATSKPRVLAMSFASASPLYVQKADLWQ
jgi:hypothetical protein